MRRSVIALVLFAASAAALPAPPGSPAHPGSYDYSPTVQYVRGADSFELFWTGWAPVLPGVNRDAVYRSTSPDLRTWSPPAVVFQGTGMPGDFDGGHVTNPTVLRNVVVAGAVRKYAMWYDGCQLWSNEAGRFGLAVSDDGLSWTRLGQLTGLDSGTPAPEYYGHLSIAVAWAPGPSPRFVALFQRHYGDTADGVYYAESWDGVAWLGQNGGPLRRVALGEWGEGANPTLDLARDPAAGRWLVTFGAPDGLRLYAVPMLHFGTMDLSQGVQTLLGTVPVTPGPGFAPGFVREADGARFGTPERWTPVIAFAQDRLLQAPGDPELVQVRWQ